MNHGRLRAPAKVNLWLEVLGKRSDGYHDIETLYVRTDWGDDVDLAWRAWASPEPRVALTVVEEGGSAPADESNLAWRAALAALDVGDPLGRWAVDIELRKRIPPGAGLGGGSSDAGAVLLGMLQSGRLELDETGVFNVAARLGSDVPFLAGGAAAAIGRGRGERLELLASSPALPIVLVLPPFGCATPAVYAHVGTGPRRAPSGGLGRAVAAWHAGDPLAWRAVHHNDLAFPALRAQPRLVPYVREVEQRLGRPPCLSGSGSALFDPCAPEEIPEVLARLAGLPGRAVVAWAGRPAIGHASAGTART